MNAVICSLSLCTVSLQTSRSNQRMMFAPPKLTVPGVFGKLRDIAAMSGSAVGYPSLSLTRLSHTTHLSLSLTHLSHTTHLSLLPVFLTLRIIVHIDILQYTV